ncbi:hypothetical protein BpHYR1_032304 [Brachionus plicatilis]|uniref:Uncharacterized protein n=1 Tax=Brachionus plicatilis TaxID=10195 RepID=A0A3M7Q590_BRAPC|nr:hypothetical protein BpHYR1_032304 [Brachionus plicatilis]
MCWAFVRDDVALGHPGVLHRWAEKLDIKRALGPGASDQFKVRRVTSSLGFARRGRQLRIRDHARPPRMTAHFCPHQVSQIVASLFCFFLSWCDLLDAKLDEDMTDSGEMLFEPVSDESAFSNTDSDFLLLLTGLSDVSLESDVAREASGSVFALEVSI